MPQLLLDLQPLFKAQDQTAAHRKRKKKKKEQEQSKGTHRFPLAEYAIPMLNFPLPQAAKKDKKEEEKKKKAGKEEGKIMGFLFSLFFIWSARWGGEEEREFRPGKKRGGKKSRGVMCLIELLVSAFSGPAFWPKEKRVQKKKKREGGNSYDRFPACYVRSEKRRKKKLLKKRKKEEVEKARLFAVLNLYIQVMVQREKKRWGQEKKKGGRRGVTTNRFS